MVKFIYMISALLVAALITGALCLLKNKKAFLGITRKVLAGGLVVVTLTRYLWDREAIHDIQGLNMYSPFGEDAASTILAIFLVWFSFVAILSTLLDQMFEFKTLRNIVKFFAIPIFVLDLVFFETYAIAISGVNVFEGTDVRATLLAVEIAIGLGLAFSKVFIEKDPLPKGKELGSFFFTLPFAILALMPTYTLQALFGYLSNSIKVDDLSFEHRLLLYFGILLPFAIYHALKNKSYEVKRFAMIYMSLAWMWTYLSEYTFETLSNPLSWPLHLCNTAMFILPLCLIFKMNKLFYFCLFVNVMGALLAMTMPTVGVDFNAFSSTLVRYWVNHYQAFFAPVLYVALGIFKRPKFKEWIYSLIAFVCYFVFILFINVWFSNYGDVDYFFLNDDFIVSKLGKWAEDTRLIEASFQMPDPFSDKTLTLTFYPLYQTLFFVCYVGITVGMWFLYEILFSLWDAAEDRRLKERDYKRMKKELAAFLQGRSENLPVSGDDSPRIQLKGFYKRYGTNKHYSVRNAWLDVRGGEIFGFLGPNGAGKSTIIKSIVGIQTITSGNIEICGYDVEKQSVQSKMNLGFVPDHYALYENLTGREYINYIADLYEVSQEDRDATIEKYVKNFQLVGAFDNQMKTYSHGMKQKIAIMAAIVHNPKVWILDEPLTGLDPTSIHEVKECMKEHAAKGNIVFFSSHIIDVVEKICDKIAIIKKGKIRAAATVAELEARNIDLEQFYLDTIYADEDAPLVSIDGDDILCLSSKTEEGDLEA